MFALWQRFHSPYFLDILILVLQHAQNVCAIAGVA